jgi:hypothetical protein
VLQELRRAVAEGVDQGVDVEIFGVGPVGDQGLVEADAEVDRGSHQRQGLDRLGVQGGEDRGHGAAHAVADQVELRRRHMGHEVVGDILHDTLDVITQGHGAVGGGGGAPVDEVDVEAAGEELSDDAAVGLEVDDVGAVDQGVADDDRLGELGGGVAAVAEQSERALLIDDLVRRGADLDGAGLVDDPRDGDQPAPEL